MKKLVLLMLVLCCCMVQQLHAQLEVVGSNEYGRIFDINYDPQVENKLYGITLGNHILVSTDNGLNWNILYSHPEVGTSLKTLRYLPDNKLSFYTNYGYSDKLCILDLSTLSLSLQLTLPIPEGSEQNWISAYSFYEANTQIAIIQQGFKIGFSNYAKVYYTSNAGKDYQEVYYNENYDGVFPNNVAISPVDSNKLFIARGLGPNDIDGGLFISEDAGASWTEVIDSIAFQAITFNPENPDDILLGSSIDYSDLSENLYRSLDGGDTWNIIPITWTAQTLDNINAIVYNPTDLNNIIVLEENEIVITYDNFVTVENFVYPVGDTHSYYYGLTASYNPFNGNEIFINSDFHPLFSTDGGETLIQSKNPYFVTTGNIDISITDEEHLYYGVQYGYVHRDLATGIDTPYEIKPLDYMSTNPGMTVYSDFILPGRVYSFTSSFMGSNLLISNDHGATTLQVFSTFASTFHTAVSDPSNPDVIWAAFSSWGESPEVYKIDFSNPDNIQSTMITLPVQDIVTGILINPQDSDSILLAIGTWIYRSEDGGLTWEMSTGLEELIAFQDLILKLTYNALDVLQFSIATTQGVFTSLDGGASWSKIIDGVFHNVVHSTTINGHIVAMQHSSQVTDFGLFFSNDGGTEWGEISSQSIAYLSSSTSAVRFIDENAEVFIGSYDLGLVKYTVNVNSVGVGKTPVVNEDIVVYPNPASANLTIFSSKTASSVEIFNLSGQIVMTSKNLPIINVSSLDDGVYFLKAHHSDGVISYTKFIKQ